MNNFKLTKQNGSVYPIRCLIGAINEITTEARIYMETDEQIDEMLLKSYCRRHQVNLTSVELFSRENYQSESFAALKSVLNTVNSNEPFKLVHFGQPNDEGLKDLLASICGTQHEIRDQNNHNPNQVLGSFHAMQSVPRVELKRPVENIDDSDAEQQHIPKKSRIIPMIDCILQESKEQCEELQTKLQTSKIRNQELHTKLQTSMTTVHQQSEELMSVNARLHLTEEKLTTATTQLLQADVRFNMNEERYNKFILDLTYLHRKSEQNKLFTETDSLTETVKTESLMKENNSLKHENTVYKDKIRQLNEKLDSTNTKLIEIETLKHTNAEQAQQIMELTEKLDVVNTKLSEAQEEISEHINTIDIMYNVAWITEKNHIKQLVFHNRQQIETPIQTPEPISAPAIQPVQPLFLTCYDTGMRKPHPNQVFDHFAFAYRGPPIAFDSLKKLYDPTIRGIRCSTDPSTQTNFIAVRLSLNQKSSAREIAFFVEEMISAEVHNLITVQPLEGHIVIFRPDFPILNPIVAAIRSGVGSVSSWDKTKNKWEL